MNSVPRPSAAQTNQALKQALKAWHQDSTVDPFFVQFYLYRKWLHKTGDNPKLALNQFLSDSLSLLQEKYERAAQFLQSRFLDQAPIPLIMNQMNLAESTLYVLQRQAFNLLTETLLATEQATATTQMAEMYERLGAQSYLDLIGVEQVLTQLEKLVTRAGPPWLLAIEGIGGIGKTALAHALLLRLIDTGQVDDIGWLTAQHQRLTLMGKLDVYTDTPLTAAQLTERLARQLVPNSLEMAPEQLAPTLRSRLKELPHVVVIDNIELTADVETLLPTLQMLAAPTKFVLTSRVSLFGVPNLYHIKLEPLDQPQALRLVRQEASLRGLPALAMSSDHALQPIYETVGGNPLALRLVVGQSHIYGLYSILQDLRQARSATATNLYFYLYQKAWADLSPLERRVLAVMQQASPHGECLETLAERGNLPPDQLRLALTQLVSLNWVDVHGGLNDRYYSIQPLTNTFLKEPVFQWQ